MGSRLLLAAAALALSACANGPAIRPVTAPGISLLCIKRNPQVARPDFIAELRAQLAARGFESLAYDDVAPAECRYRMLYWASWHWDLAMYLHFADLRVYDGAALVGEASYDARASGLRLGKYHPTSEKLGFLLDRLFPKAAPRP